MRCWMYAMVVFTVAFTSASLRAESAESTSNEPVLVMKEDLFNMDDADTRGLQEVPGAQTITIYRAEDDSAKFSNHPQITWFKGYYYATWQATPKDEDSDDSVAVFSRSADGSNWSAPQVL
ncbi:MAG: hypothetical protein IT445_14750, partial [Phycisphaeraceae bacterium]|nr:hypothetical protein [Phycisphaeraceae bacterium]